MASPFGPIDDVYGDLDDMTPEQRQQAQVERNRRISEVEDPTWGDLTDADEVP